MTKRIVGLVAAVCCLLVVAPASLAQGYGPFDTAINYGGNCVDRLGTGLDNAVLGWTDVIVYPAKGAIQQDAGTPVSNLAYHLPVGIAIGSASAVGRTAKGILQTATFLIPKNDFWDRY